MQKCRALGLLLVLLVGHSAARVSTSSSELAGFGEFVTNHNAIECRAGLVLSCYTETCRCVSPEEASIWTYQKITQAYKKEMQTKQWQDAQAENRRKDRVYSQISDLIGYVQRGRRENLKAQLLKEKDLSRQEKTLAQKKRNEEILAEVNKIFAMAPEERQKLEKLVSESKPQKGYKKLSQDPWLDSEMKLAEYRAETSMLNKLVREQLAKAKNLA